MSTDAVAVLGFEAQDPSGYGRLVERDGKLEAIVEHKDATPEQRQIKLCNAGLMALAGELPDAEIVGGDATLRGGDVTEERFAPGGED